MLCSVLTIPHHCFSLSPKLKVKRTVDHATPSAALKTLAPRFPGRHLSLPLSLYLRLSIPTFGHSKAQCRKWENPRFVFFFFPHSKRVEAAFSLPRARCLPSPGCCLSRIRGQWSAPLLFFLLSTRFATSLTFVFRSFSSAFLIKHRFSAPFHGLQRVACALLLDPTEHRQRSSKSFPPFDGDSVVALKQVLCVSKTTSLRISPPLPRRSEEEVDYSTSPSRQRQRQATDDGTAAALHSQGHNRARRCTGNTEELSTLWRTSDDGEKDSLFFVFDSNDGTLSPCRIPWQPARLLVSMATLCFELGDSLPRSASLLFAIGFGDWDTAEEL